MVFSLFTIITEIPLTLNYVGSDLVEVFIRDLALAVLGDGFVDAK